MEAFMGKVRRESNSKLDPDEESVNSQGDHTPHDMDEEIPMSSEDVELCQHLDEEYERALEEREIGYNARYGSVRQSALISVFFMVSFLFLGTAFFIRQAQWTIPDSLLFSIYTITTVGYGYHEIPTGPAFQAYTIFYLFIGIAALTIMVAQVFMCIELEASRAQHRRDRTKFNRRLGNIITRTNHQQLLTSTSAESTETNPDEIIALHHDNLPGCIDKFFRCMDHSRSFFSENEVGRGISVIFPFASLILIGAAVVGPLEGWTFLESVYFAVVSLTTVGYGDYYPTKSVTIWFCILWLPFSIGFMSLFLGKVASFYIRLSDRNIERIERRMRRRLQQAKDRAEVEKAEVLKRAYRGQQLEIKSITTINKIDETESETEEDGAVEKPQLDSKVRKKQGFDVLPSNDGGSSQGDESSTISLFGSSIADKGNIRRQRIIDNSTSNGARKSGTRKMQSMRDIVRAVRNNMNTSGDSAGAPVVKSPQSQLMSIRSTQTIVTNQGIVGLRRTTTRKPSFGLRVLVQERFAEIIATEIAGFQSSIEIHENTLFVKIDRLKEITDKWQIPRRARKAFRAVSFEVLYFVGEHGLITRGTDALFDLTPIEFHGLFSSLVAAMGDADTMEGWLDSTHVLADVDLLRTNALQPDMATNLKDASNKAKSNEPQVKPQKVARPQKESV